MTHSRAVLYLLVASSMWSIGGLFIKLVPAHPLAIAGVRSGIAAFVILAYLRKPKFIWTRAQWCSAVSYAAIVMLFVSATKLTTAANAILLQYTAPIYVALLSPLILKEKIKPIDWFATTAVIAGMILFFFESLSPTGLLGNALAILSGIAFAGLVFSLKKQNGVSTIESVFLGNILTCLVNIPFISQIDSSPTTWGLLFTLGIIQLGIPYILYTLAVSRVTALESTLIVVIEPILNPIWVMLFYGEAPSVWALMGGTVVLVALTLRSIILQRTVRSGS